MKCAAKVFCKSLKQSLYNTKDVICLNFSKGFNTASHNICVKSFWSA